MNKHISKADVTGLSSAELKVRLRMFQAKSPDPEVVTITPDQALIMTEEYNGFNRDVDWGWVGFLAKEMKNSWQINGEAIIISDQGELLDGQHRLYACVQANVPFKTILVKGITKEAFKTINTGKRRNAKDVFTIAAKQKQEPTGRSATLAASAAVCIEYNNGWLKKRSTSGFMVSPQEKLAYVEVNPKLAEYVKMGVDIKKSPIKRQIAIVAAISYLGSKKYQMKSDMFLRGVLSGEMLDGRSPLLALHRKFLDNEKTRMRRWEKIAYTILAYNKHINNERITTLKIMNEEVPTLI